MLEVIQGQDLVFDKRKMQNCSGLTNVKIEGKKLLITVPSDDPTNRTFFYTYIFSTTSQKWEDKGRP
jgi:hypothetical protein